MVRLVHASPLRYDFARRAQGLLPALALGVLVACSGPHGPGGLWLGSAVIAWTALVASRARAMARRGESRPMLVELELGMLLAAGLVTALLRIEGGLGGRLAPAVYVLVAVVVTFTRPAAAALVVAWIMVLETAVWIVALGETTLWPRVPHMLVLASFALVNFVSVRAQRERIRMTARARIEQELVRIKEDARSYRLLGAGDIDQPNGQSEERLARSSVEEIHESVHYALDLVRRSLHLHSAALLWLNHAGSHLRISEISTVSGAINYAPLWAGDGILGAVIARRECVSLQNLKASYKIPYYVGPCPVRAALALPVIEGATLRGIVALDRRDNVAFSPDEQEIAMQAARFCLRTIQNERIFVQLERAKVEQGKLYRAAQGLGAALSEREVLEAGVGAAQEIASIDFAVVTIFDHGGGEHEVCAVKGEGGALDALVGARFSHNAGLASMVVQTRYPLPYKGEFDSSRQIVLDRTHALPCVPSLLVLPLIMHDRALGTLILGSRRRQAFGDPVRPTLEVLASHLAVSLSNARLIHKLETMATTDGMTGLHNKRAMLDLAVQKLAAAARFGRPLSVLIADIDFFKKVNDTHGHDIGDLVIRALGDILKRQKRATDVVARYGGEEFVALCEQTDEQGAMLLAERIREEVSRSPIVTPRGTLQVTCSLGIATFPEAGADWEALFKAADEALYVSKRTGRNRTTIWRAPRKPAADRKEPPRPPHARTAP